jgi:16S rRNA (uracil1498-N3)-methyltransferase
MSIHRFFCPALSAGEISLSPDEARHATQVLRLRAGDEVELFDGNGRRAAGRLQHTSKREAVVTVPDVAPPEPRPTPQLTLITALPRLQRQPFLFEKCTELGVTRIVPVLYQRGTVKPQASAVGKWRRTVIEAAKQSGCLYLPEVVEPQVFAQALVAHASAELRLFGVIGLGAGRLVDVLAANSRAERVEFWIGPEGGLDSAEAAALSQSGAQGVRLGNQVLRVETAALAVAAAFALRR